MCICMYTYRYTYIYIYIRYNIERERYVYIHRCAYNNNNNNTNTTTNHNCHWDEAYYVLPHRAAVLESRAGRCAEARSLNRPRGLPSDYPMKSEPPTPTRAPDNQFRHMYD